MPTKAGDAPTRALQGLDRFVRARMKEWHVCGLSVGAVSNGGPVYLKGFGLRDVRRNLPVTSWTQFGIASATKAFTATAAGILVDEGKLDLDRPVREYLPDFRLKDPFASERMTTRDLLCHRSGLPRHDMVWYKTPFTRHELVGRLRHLEPTKDFRQAYQYQNLMFMTAGVVIEQISGVSWEKFVSRRILEPLGMEGANCSIEQLRHSSDHAVGHRWNGKRYVRIPHYVQGAVAPAGAVNACAEAMCKWIAMNLNKGRYDGQRIISERMLAEIQSPQMAMPGVPAEPEMGPSAYGLGWSISTYRGHLLAMHGGAIDGFRSHVALLPRDGHGVAVLSNFEASGVPGGDNLCTVVAFNVLDRLLGLEPVPWVRRVRKAVRKREAEKKAKKTPPQEPEAKPASRPLADYVGQYRHAAYGALNVTRSGNGLRADLHGMPFRLRHQTGDAFRGRLLHYPTQFGFEFRVSEKQGVHSVLAMLDSEHKDLLIRFRRIASPAARQA